jgi:excisionase family DNA binding protein
MDDLLTVKEAAQLLTIKESILRDWILRRKIQTVRIGEKIIRLRKAEVLSKISDQK